MIAEAVETAAWIPIGSLAEHAADKHKDTSRPCAEYRACERAVTLYGTTYRAVVVHSSAHDKRRQKKLAKAIVELLHRREIGGDGGAPQQILNLDRADARAHAPRHEVGDAGEGTRAEGMAMTTSRAASRGAATGARSGQRERDLRVSGRPVEAFEPDGQHDEWDREEAEGIRISQFFSDLELPDA